ncbi:MAG: site-2 protease family protein [Pyrinomonadaceae bacterium]
MATALTSTFAGVLLAAPQGIEPSLADPVEWFDYITYIPLYYVAQVWLLMVEALRHPALLAEGAKFAGSLLSILGAHEAGHYLMCRRYGVRATLPFFLPAPPLFLAGTFGAFIKIKSPIPSRRALFDIGLAGPLAGFAVALPIAVWGLATAQTAPTTSLTGGGVIFHDPLLFRLLAAPMNLELTNLAGNPFTSPRG